jgi:hypothetical protein
MSGGQGRELPTMAVKDNALGQAGQDLPASLGGVGFS